MLHFYMIPKIERCDVSVIVLNNNIYDLNKISPHKTWVRKWFIDSKNTIALKQENVQQHTIV